jgi:hypothetical protein
MVRCSRRSLEFLDRYCGKYVIEFICPDIVWCETGKREFEIDGHGLHFDIAHLNSFETGGIAEILQPIVEITKLIQECPTRSLH